LLKRRLNLALPFAELRELCNEVGLQLYEDLSPGLARLRLRERFFEACRWAVAGNVLDFRTAGTGYEMGLEHVKAFLAEASATLERDERAEFFDLLRPGLRVLYVHDNVGEMALDRLLIEALKAAGAHVVSAVREGPITSDATLEDAERLQLAASADEIIIACPDTLGISLSEATPELERELATCDLIVSKGQANYYVLSEPNAAPGRAIVFLLRTKCELVEAELGLTQREANVIAVRNPRESEVE